MNQTLLLSIPLLPLAGAVFNMLFGIRAPRRLVELSAVAGVAASTLVALMLWPAAGNGVEATFYTWMTSGELDVPLTMVWNNLSAPMTVMVTFVSTLIHLYAVGYMHKEPDNARFFGLLNLFVFAMLLIVLSDNLLLIFVGWEGVGFCSYALIGFWYKDEANADAGRKAFLVTRVGDVFFGIALLWLFSLTGTLSLSAINSEAALLPIATITIIGILLLLGASGKSAQLPLMTWLADAMAGPTPVSALIHAATMVTAGVYLLCRFFPLISLSPVAMLLIAGVGAATAFYAATCALAQREIKRVLAYSTMSQVGYMLLAVGAGSVSAAMFHLLTHALFKALLFMGAGLIIHYYHEENDLFQMGGLARRQPLLFGLFLSGAICLAGLPLTGGFFSKDAILLAVFQHPNGLYKLFWAIGLLTAFLTALYTFRLLYLVFAGKPPVREGHAAGGLTVWPLLPLAILGLAGGFINLPELIGGGAWLHNSLGVLAGVTPKVSHSIELLLWGAATLAALAGWLLARQFYNQKPAPRTGRIDDFLLNGWYADRLIDRLLVRPYANLCLFCSQGIDRDLIDNVLTRMAQTCREFGGGLCRFSTGRLSTSIGAMVWGVLMLLCWGLWRLVSL